MNSQQDNHQGQDKCSEDAVYRLLRSAGWVFPKTPSEVDRTERELAQNPVLVPDDITNPYEILDWLEQGKAPTVSNAIPLPENTELTQDLARAAREGNGIPDELEERMASDRRKAEQDADAE